MCWEAVSQISGEDWEGPLADGSKVEGWHSHSHHKHNKIIQRTVGDNRNVCVFLAAKAIVN